MGKSGGLDPPHDRKEVVEMMKSISRGPAWAALAVILLAGLGPAGCDEDSDTATNPTNGGEPAGNEVWMRNTSFVPDTLRITVGTTVTWINKDPVIHTVVSGTPLSPDGLFASGNIQQDEIFDHEFTAAGTFPYFCSVHPDQMRGVIISQ